MNELELSRINTRSPYSVWKEDEAYLFKQIMTLFML